MPLPSAVQKQDDDAKAWFDEQRKKQQEGTPDNLAAVPTATPAPDQPPPANQPAEDTWEKRYVNYKTATDKTIHEQRQQISDLTSTVASLQQQVQSMMTQHNTPDPKQQADDDEAQYQAWVEAVTTKEEREEYSEAYLRMQYKMYLHQQKGIEKQLAGNPIQSKVDNLEQTVAKTATQLYEEKLDLAFPNDRWITLTDGTTDGWNEFAATKPSPFDPRTYNDIIDQASKQLDANTVIQVLKAFEQSLATPTPKPPAPANPLEAQLTPEGAGGALPNQQPTTPVFTADQVKQFYDDMSKGKYTAEEFARIEADIQAANAAGNVR